MFPRNTYRIDFASVQELSIFDLWCPQQSFCHQISFTQCSKLIHNQRVFLIKTTVPTDFAYPTNQITNKIERCGVQMLTHLMAFLSSFTAKYNNHSRNKKSKCCVFFNYRSVHRAVVSCWYHCAGSLQQTG
jgi:hypothetical protein